MNRIKTLLTYLGLDWFLCALIAMVSLAYFFPGPGILQQPISLAELANYGISVIFFFYGLKLNAGKLKTGLTNWRMHTVIQLTTFIFFPLLILCIKPCFTGLNAEPVWFGIFFLAALPSTVSSSVVMVSMAGGNIPGAIFNASISALLGVFITPLWIASVLQSDTGNIDLTSIVLKLAVQVLLPVIIGMALNRRLGSFADKHKKGLKNFDQGIILLIIYTSFCKSFTEHVFENMTLLEIIFLSLGMLFLFLVAMFFMKFISKLLKFNRGDTVTVMFCGSKKSLVHGTVMSGILFAGNPIAGFILLPLLLYHAIQLITASLMAKRMALNN